MSVTVVGSLNEDVVVTVDRLPGRGETVIGTRSPCCPAARAPTRPPRPAGSAPACTWSAGWATTRPAAGSWPRSPSSRVNVGRVHRTAGVPTGTATIPVEDGQRREPDRRRPRRERASCTPDDVDVESVHRAGVLLLQLEMPLETVLAAAAATRGTVVLNPAPPQPLPAELLARVDVLVPNEHELAQLAGAAAGDAAARRPGGAGPGWRPAPVVVTLGARGALVVPAEGPALLQAPPPVEAVDTTGAGDCFCGALSSALDRGEQLAEAVRYAVTAAALSTTGPGARGALPDDDAVRALLPRTPAATAAE